MRGSVSYLALVTLICAAAGLGVGCGGGSASNSTSGAAGSTSATDAAQPATTGTVAPASVQHKVNQVQPRFGSSSQVPHVKGGDNSIQDFGQEASQADRLAAARALTVYLAAISSGDAKTACALLASTMTQRLRQLGASAPRGSAGCPALVAQLTASMPAQLRRQLGSVRVLSVRVDGDRGFIIFDGVGRKVANMPLSKEAGGWRVAAIGPIPLQY